MTFKARGVKQTARAPNPARHALFWAGMFQILFAILGVTQLRLLMP